MAKRKRDMQLNFRVSAEELAVIEQKMSQFGTSNREAYLRKMALDIQVLKHPVCGFLCKVPVPAFQKFWQGEPNVIM